ncbi:hypothetical protein GCM10011375_28190 [Hymenobacter qilianensis]|uniref:Uncharacterized protein n=2 Tax=Hymenobacter qilianensis TaxID=1385715 RepID=A0ACB5PTX2_9BACT|nr:hypothetical protein [Hymenobacter qilianensis]QNP52868.1 hypothetical protein H9L05_03895 [Hymenobacter qilianensis]GGF71379.1 hypothetical protein GCM10011375_28190 [Hymenobacter qilianensis]
MRKPYIILLYASVIAAITGCEKEDNPSQECVSSTMLGTTCEGASLLQIDTALPIGSSLYFSGDMGTVIPGPAAVPATYANVVQTFQNLPALRRGEQLFIRLRPATSDEQVERFCTANKVMYSAPQVMVIDSFCTVNKTALVN